MWGWLQKFAAEFGSHALELSNMAKEAHEMAGLGLKSAKTATHHELSKTMNKRREKCSGLVDTINSFVNLSQMSMTM